MLDGLDDAAACGDLLKQLEAAVLHDIRQVAQLHGEAHIGVVFAVALHGILVGDPRKRGLEVTARPGLEEVRHEAFHGRDDVVFVDEGHLHVDLGELGLAIGPQIFVAETLDDLEIAVEARDHQKLLEDLRRLGQRIERALVDAAGHEIIPRAFRCAFRENGRFDLDEPPAR